MLSLCGTFGTLVLRDDPLVPLLVLLITLEPVLGLDLLTGVSLRSIVCQYVVY